MFQNRLGLLIVGWKFTVFALFYFVFEDPNPISKYQLPGTCIRKGNLMEGFLRYEFGGAYIWRGLYMKGLTGSAFHIQTAPSQGNSPC